MSLDYFHDITYLLSMNDKSFGYIILVFLGIFITSLVGYGISVILFPAQTIMVSFDRISNLRVDDPVKVKGVTIGNISNLTLDDARAIVAIRTLKPVTIYQGYKIYTTDKGILGDRIIVLENGDETNPPVDLKDTLPGIFYPGVSDALGSTYKLKELALTFKQTAHVLLSGSEGKPSLVSAIQKVLSQIDTFTLQLNTFALTLNAELPVLLDTLKTVSHSAQKMSDDIGNTLTEKLPTLAEQVDALAEYAGKLDSLVAKLSEIIGLIEKNKLMTDDYITPVTKQLSDIRDIIAMILDGTLKLRLLLKAGF